VTLHGSSTDADGDTISYSWNCVKPLGGCIGLPAGNQEVEFTAPKGENDTPMTFKLTASDSKGGSDTDNVKVTVQGTGGGAQGQSQEEEQAGQDSSGASVQGAQVPPQDQESTSTDS